MSTAGNPTARTPCPHCGAGIKLPPLAAGSAVTCPRCNQAFTPGRATPAEPPRTNSAPPPPAKSNPSHLVGASQQTPPTAPPPKPPRKSQPTEPEQFGFPCRLCGTRMYATDKQLGQQHKCPDCHTPNEVQRPAAKPAPPKGPSLDDAEEFNLSDPGERPRYQSIVRAEGDDAILNLLNHPPFELGPPLSSGASPEPAAPQRPAAPQHLMAPQRPAAPHRAGQPTPPPPPADSDDDLDELRLSDPIERPVHTVEIPKVAVPLEPEWPNNRRDREEDGFWTAQDIGEGPERWQKAPLLVGVFEFLFRPQVLARWIGHALVMTALLMMVSIAIRYANAGYLQFASLALSMVSVVVGFGWAVAFGSTCLSIVQDTANGQDEIESWTGTQFGEWFSHALYMLVAAVVSALPGILFGSYVFGAGGPVIAAPLAIAISMLAFLPIVLSSMLAEGSPFAIVSPTVLSLMRVASQGWVLFYLETMVIGLLALVGIGLWQFESLVGFAPSAALLVMLTLLYMRLVGRLLWYSQKKLSEEEQQANDERRRKSSSPAE